VSSVNSFDGFTPLLIVASVQRSYVKCSSQIKKFFTERDVLEIIPPTKQMSRTFFRKIVDEALQEPTVFDGLFS
jgi:hypothetical protein